MQANQNHTVMSSALPKHQVAEVLVHGYEHRAVRGRDREDLVVRDPRTHLGHVRHFMTRDSQCIDDRLVNTLVA
jgi:hypothetical protein